MNKPLCFHCGTRMPLPPGALECRTIALVCCEWDRDERNDVLRQGAWGMGADLYFRQWLPDFVFLSGDRWAA